MIFFGYFLNFGWSILFGFVFVFVLFKMIRCMSEYKDFLVIWWVDF